MSYVELIGAVISGGILQSLIQYFITRKKESRNDFDAIIKTWAEDNRRLREMEAQSRARINELDSKVISLQNKITLLESAHQDLPIPMWLKDMDGVMLAVNASYEETFLIPNNKTIEDYIGKTDFDVWPKEVAESFRNHDKLVMRTKKVFNGEEDVLIGGEMIQYSIIKYPRYAGRVIIGIAGIAIPQ